MYQNSIRGEMGGTGQQVWGVMGSERLRQSRSEYRGVCGRSKAKGHGMDAQAMGSDGEATEGGLCRPNKSKVGEELAEKRR